MSDQVAEMSATYLVEAARNAVPEGYKQTEVGVIPNNWKVIRLKELGLDISDGNYSSKYPRAEEFKPVGIPFIRANNIKGLTVVDDDMRFISHMKHFEITKGHLKEGDILITNRGEIGNIAVVPSRHIGSNINAQIVRINTGKSGLLGCYFAFYLQRKETNQRLLEMQTGSALKQLPVNRLLTLSIAIPSQKEQAAIANALSDVDALINELEKLIAKKQAIKTATMQQLLTGRTRLPQFSLRKNGTPKGYKQSELGEIPEDWETVPFRSLLSIRHGKNQKIVEEENGKYPIFATGGRIGWANSYLWDKPSVLIGRKGTINKPRYADKPFWTVDTLFYSEISPHAEAKFIYFKFCMVDWMQYNEASGVPSLSTNTIESILTTAPVKEEQTAIANVLSDMDEEIQALEQRLGKTRQIKQGMMQELLTGKTRLVVPAV